MVLKVHSSKAAIIIIIIIIIIELSEWPRLLPRTVYSAEQSLG
jgi:hypothetical protein